MKITYKRESKEGVIFNLHTTNILGVFLGVFGGVCMLGGCVGGQVSGYVDEWMDSR